MEPRPRAGWARPARPRDLDRPGRAAAGGPARARGRQPPRRAGGARRADRPRRAQDLRGGGLVDPGAGVLLGARARGSAGHRAGRVLRVRGRGARRPGLAGGHAPARGHGLQPGHGRPLVGRQLRDRGREGPAAVPDADLGPPEPDRQWLRASGGQPDRDRGPGRDEGDRDRGPRRRAAAAGGRQLLAGRRREPAGPPAARDPSAGGAELRAGRPRAVLAEVADAARLHPARGAGAPSGQLPGPGARPADPPPGGGGRHGGAVRRPPPHLLSPQRLRRRRVRHRHPGQLPGERLRLPRGDPLSGRSGQRQPGGRGDAPERDLHPRGGLRHPVEALRLADRLRGGAALPPAGGVVHRHRGQLRVRLLLVLLPGRDHPARGQADRHRLERGGDAGRDAALGRAGRAPGVRVRSTSTSSTSGWT